MWFGTHHDGDESDCRQREFWAKSIWFEMRKTGVTCEKEIDDASVQVGMREGCRLSLCK
jgi:hypothetical protein